MSNNQVQLSIINFTNIFTFNKFVIKFLATKSTLHCCLYNKVYSGKQLNNMLFT